MDKITRPINIVFFGDSVCFGQYVSLHRCWVTLVAQKLSEKYDVVVTNSSINGSTTRQALERMSYDLSKLNMDIITIQYGMNDANYWETDKGCPRVALATFKANLNEIMIRAQTFGAKRIFLVTNHPTTKNKDVLPFTNITYQASLLKYNEAILEVVETARQSDCSIGLIDIEAYFYQVCEQTNVTLAELLLPDNLHLSIKGHQVYFEYVYPIIEKAVKELLCNTKSSS